jgi:small GTP-binding protein
MNEQQKKINENKDFIFYHKVNIFGESGVGKSTLISLMDNSENKDNNDFQVNKNLSLISVDSYNETHGIVQQIKKANIVIDKENKKENLYLNIYETNINGYNSIKMNLDTLLFQTQCVIVMWDNSEIDSFKNVDDLVSVIISLIKEKKIKKIPIFLIRNKTDLNPRISDATNRNKIINDINNSIKKVKEKYQDYITYKEISLLKNDDNTFHELISDINTKIVNKENNYLKDDIYNSIKLLINPKEENEYYPNDFDKTFKCILLGHSAVGKTTFVNTIQGKQENSITTIGIESITILTEICDEKNRIELCDTGGQERFECVTRNYIRDVDGILLMFDVTNVDSFKKVDRWISSVKENNNKKYEMLLIGNKIDLNDKRIISKVEAKKKANNYNINYYECCPLNGLNVYEILIELILTLYKNKEKNKEKQLPGDNISLNRKEIKKKTKKCC